MQEPLCSGTTVLTQVSPQTNPWIMVNPNYTKINAKDQVNREDSVFKYYQKLIKLRHESELTYTVPMI